MALIVSLLLVLGCKAKADQRIVVTDLPQASTTVDGSWQSAPFFSSATPTEWISYPGSATLEIHHGLGRVPSLINVYLSFDENGTGAGLAAGDLAHIIEVNATTIELSNDTEQDYFARVVLR